MSQSHYRFLRFTLCLVGCLAMDLGLFSSAEAVAQSGARAYAGSNSRGRARSGSNSRSKAGSSSRGGSSTKAPLEERGFVLVEMFTSEGYRSFRTSDKQIEWIEKTGMDRALPVYTLAFHVDRLNTEEFQDPFATSGASLRQEAYAERHARGSVAAPLVMINGETRLPGKRGSAKEYINIALGSNPSLDDSSINASAFHSGSDVEVRWEGKGMKPGDRLNLALVQKKATNEVTTASSSVVTVNHVNVVRDFKSVEGSALKETEASSVLKMPKDVPTDQFHVVAYIQSTSGVVNAAALVKIGEKPEMADKDGSSTKADGSTTKKDGSGTKASMASKDGSSTKTEMVGKDGSSKKSGGSASKNEMASKAGSSSKSSGSNEKSGSGSK